MSDHHRNVGLQVVAIQRLLNDHITNNTPWESLRQHSLPHPHTTQREGTPIIHTLSHRFRIDGGTSNAPLILAGIEDHLIFEAAVITAQSHRSVQVMHLAHPMDDILSVHQVRQQILGRDDGAHHTTNPLVDFE